MAELSRKTENPKKRILEVLRGDAIEQSKKVEVLKNIMPGWRNW